MFFAFQLVHMSTYTFPIIYPLLHAYSFDAHSLLLPPSTQCNSSFLFVFHSNSCVISNTTPTRPIVLLAAQAYLHPPRPETTNPTNYVTRLFDDTLHATYTYSATIISSSFYTVPVLEQELLVVFIRNIDKLGFSLRLVSVRKRGSYPYPNLLAWARRGLVIRPFGEQD